MLSPHELGVLVARQRDVPGHLKPAYAAGFEKAASEAIRHHMITGAPGTGKTTRGLELSQTLGLPLLSLDDLPADPGNPWPGTDEARRVVKQLKAPHVVEGAQIMGFPSDELSDHDIELLEQSKRELLRRLVRRGIQTTEAMTLAGAKDKAAIRKRIEDFQHIVDAYKARRPRE